VAVYSVIFFLKEHNRKERSWKGKNEVRRLEKKKREKVERERGTGKESGELDARVRAKRRIIQPFTLNEKISKKEDSMSSPLALAPLHHSPAAERFLRYTWS
jgi:ribosomal protein L19E